MTSPHTLLVICQRILDHYFLHITGHTAHSLSSQVLETNRDRFISQLPDSSEDTTAFHHAQALLARLDAHLGASAFYDVYASSEIHETQCREAFRTIFEAMGQIQHFEMMTAQGGPTWQDDR